MTAPKPPPPVLAPGVSVDAAARLVFSDLKLGPSVAKRLGDHLGSFGVEAGFSQEESDRHDVDRNK
jgi:hypothetical protein